MLAKTKMKYPFNTIAFCLLSDHIHFIIELPEDEKDFPKRISMLKALFTKSIKENKNQYKHVDLGEQVWQARYWEHVIRDEKDLVNHINYIHYNPVKHGLVDSPEKWEWSTYSGTNIKIEIDEMEATLAKNFGDD